MWKYLLCFHQLLLSLLLWEPESEERAIVRFGAEWKSIQRTKWFLCWIKDEYIMTGERVMWIHPLNEPLHVNSPEGLEAEIHLMKEFKPKGSKRRDSAVSIHIFSVCFLSLYCLTLNTLLKLTFLLYLNNLKLFKSVVLNSYSPVSPGIKK